MLGLMEYVLRDKDDADVTMMIAFRKQMTHKSSGIGVVKQFVQ